MKNSIIVLCCCIFFLVGFSMNHAYASIDVNNCSNCHDAVVSDFEVASLERSSQCTICHGRAWHAQWKDPETGRLAAAKYISGVGYFKSADSVDASKEELHSIHSGNNSYSGRYGCSSCHGVATCTSCHNNVNHNQHSETEFNFPSFYQASGVSFAPFKSSCSLSECHQTLPDIKLVSAGDGSQLCTNCHSRFGASAKDLSGHNPAAIDNSHSTQPFDTLTVTDTNYTVDCSGCHSSALDVEHQNNEKDCLVCHNPSATIPQNVKGVVQNANNDIEKKSCTKCHFNTNVLAEPAEHQLYHVADKSDSLTVVGGPHESCNTCHERQDMSQEINLLANGSDKNYSCLNCHNLDYNMAPLHQASLGSNEEMMELTALHTGCSTCHSNGTEAAVKVNLIADSLEQDLQVYNCNECHNDMNLAEAHAGIIDQNCTKYCHSSSLTEEHLEPNGIGHQVNSDNSLTCGTCHGNSNLIIKSAVTVGDTNCITCHTMAHDIFIRPVPEDIPLYPGYEWGLPQSAEIWAGEAWMPSGYEQGKLVISGRRNDISEEEVWEYYDTEMRANGWELISDDSTSTDYFKVEFSKENRKVMVFFYGGELHSSYPIILTGYRLEILYQ